MSSDTGEDVKPAIGKKRPRTVMTDETVDANMASADDRGDDRGLELALDLLRKKASPIVRVRAEHDWGNLAGAAFRDDDGKYFTIAVRAIGDKLLKPKPAAPDDPLIRALTQLKIRPKVLYNCEHVDYAYEWLVIISRQDVEKLPSYTNDVRGIFCDPGPQGNLAFVWTMPLFGDLKNGDPSREHCIGFLVKWPAILRPNLIAPGFLRDNLYVDSDRAADCTLISVSDVRPIRSRVEDVDYMSGDWSVKVNAFPEGLTTQRFWKYQKSAGIWAKWKDTSICLTLDPVCVICGADEHPPGDEDCPYEAALTTARSRMARPKIQLLGSSDDEESAPVQSKKPKASTSRPSNVASTKTVAKEKERTAVHQTKSSKKEKKKSRKQ